MAGLAPGRAARAPPMTLIGGLPGLASARQRGAGRACGPQRGAGAECRAAGGPVAERPGRARDSHPLGAGESAACAGLSGSLLHAQPVKLRPVGPDPGGLSWGPSATRWCWCRCVLWRPPALARYRLRSASCISGTLWWQPARGVSNTHMERRPAAPCLDSENGGRRPADQSR